MLSDKELHSIYFDIHTHPELAFTETRTAGIVAQHLQDFGYEVSTGIGVTGVVGVLKNGDGPTILLRADFDALPIRDLTGLSYAFLGEVTDRNGEKQPAMHACGHDIHTTSLLGAAAQLMDQKDQWSGTLICLFQPAEEIGEGARRMIDDGLYTKVPKPDLVLAQHVMTMPWETVRIHVGAAFSIADTIEVVFHGQGAHGSMPEKSVDPVVMASMAVVRLQTIVSRSVGPDQFGVVTVGSIQSGTQANIIPDEARLLINIRAFDSAVRDTLVERIKEICIAESQASKAPRDPDITLTNHFNLVENDSDKSAVIFDALTAAGDCQVAYGPRSSGSEDTGDLATAAGCPIVYWTFGGFDPERFEPGQPPVPQNHSPYFAPDPDHCLTQGVSHLVHAAQAVLGK